ncbi:MAG: Uma2 family endonuclease [Bacteroidota bacterium]
MIAALPHMLPPKSERVTYEAYLKRAPEGKKTNLINGVLHVDMSASSLHERVQGFLLSLLRMFVSKHKLGQVLGSRTPVRLDEENGAEPDILFVQADREHIIGRVGLDDAPDMVVEIISPSSRIDDRVRKFIGYEQIGVREYWLIDPERKTAEFFRQMDTGAFAEVTPERGQPFHSEVVDGFWLDPAWLLADELPNDYDTLQRILDA